MKVAVRLTKNILLPLGVGATSAIDTRIQKKIHGSGTTTVIISKEKMNDLMKIVQPLEDFNILLKRQLLRQLKMKQTNKQTKKCFRNVVRYFRSKFVRKYFNMESNFKTWLLT